MCLLQLLLGGIEVKSKIFKLLNIFMIMLVSTLSLVACIGEDSIEHANLSDKVDEYVDALNELNYNPIVNGTIIIGDDKEVIFSKSYGMVDFGR